MGVTHERWKECLHDTDEVLVIQDRVDSGDAIDNSLDKPSHRTTDIDCHDDPARSHLLRGLLFLDFERERGTGACSTAATLSTTMRKAEHCDISWKLW